MEQPLNVATPAVTVMLFPPVQVSAPGPPLVGVPVAIDNATTVELAVTTVLPAASWTRIVGCVLKATPLVIVAGGVEGHPMAVPQQKASLVAPPEPIVKLGPMTDVKAGEDVAERV